MHKIQLFEAWKMWLTGHAVHDSVLWGMDILWWGRIGKAVSFAAGLTIIADIVGAETLRNFGNSLHSAYSINKADVALKEALKYVKLSWRVFVADTKSVAYQKLQNELGQYGKSQFLDVVISLALIVYGVYLAWKFFGVYLEWSYSALFLIVPGANAWAVLALLLVSPLITFSLVFVLTLAGVAVDTVIIEPIAWIISRPSIDKLIKIVAVILLIVGFHFDLLAS